MSGIQSVGSVNTNLKSQNVSFQGDQEGSKKSVLAYAAGGAALGAATGATGSYFFAKPSEEGVLKQYANLLADENNGLKELIKTKFPDDKTATVDLTADEAKKFGFTGEQKGVEKATLEAKVLDKQAEMLSKTSNSETIAVMLKDSKDEDAALKSVLTKAKGQPNTFEETKSMLKNVIEKKGNAEGLDETAVQAFKNAKRSKVWAHAGIAGAAAAVALGGYAAYANSNKA